MSTEKNKSRTTQTTKHPLVLLKYRDREGKRTFQNTSFPLIWGFKPSATKTREARLKIGLPTNGNINMILLLVESMRIFELKNETITPDIFPRLRPLLARHGILFTQSYSSGENTDNDDFATSCSQLLDLQKTTYHRSPTVRVRCLSSYFQNNV